VIRTLIHTLIATFVTFAIVGSASASPLTVDAFTTPISGGGIANFSATGTVTSATTPQDSSLLGSRVASLTNTAFSGGSSAFVGNSSLSIMSGSATFGTAGTNITNVGTLAYTLSTPLNLSGYDAMFTVASFNAGNGSPPPPTTVFVTLVDEIGGTQTTSSVLITGTGPLSVPLGNLARSETTSLSFSFTQSNSADITITPLELLPPSTVPEPTTWATFGALALFGVFVTRRQLKAVPVAQT